MIVSRRYHTNSYSLFSTISFAAVLIIILLVTSIFCNFSLHRDVLDKKHIEHEIVAANEVHRRIQSNSWLSVQEEVKKTYVKYLIPSHPPINVTEEERIEWFRKELPTIEIFKSTEKSQKFGIRVQMFFQRGCEIQFFMTWISPAKSFGKRELLAVESVFKAHPNGCLMILSQTMDSTQGKKILKPLTQYGFKVLAVSPDLSFLFKDTPAEAWFDEIKKGNKDPGEIPLAQNLSNLLRLAVLYKYGGVYLDTDFIVMKKLSGLRNVIGAQSIDAESGNWTRLNNAVLIFDKYHPLVFKFIQEFSLTFDGNKWGHNGPYLVSRVVERVKNRPDYNFTVLPPIAFYPVYWTRIGGFFQKPTNLVDSKWVKAKLLQLSGETYGVHLWNKQSSRLKIDEGSIIGHLISKNCVLCEHIYSA
ncbi:Lactosylceramide 4-alpha-galactosyltransferase [Thalictrum thalictroides]|uniref:Lactosylceramide 4-alpha-galactosyltransferase n=1 Tax=Thalictrum thalictroides TaxID=46969 RepID=A0A7J6W8X0_THATH|nr:Lactosylceramide 4-alpha-galactosyltransferase [Thalictrum thalictroides]